MGDNVSVHLHAYGDLAQCRVAVASVTNHLPDATIHVCDGRYTTFEGETDLTPGLASFCGRHPNARYHAPPERDLPFGIEGAPDEYRPGNYAKARWVFDEVLPDDKWTLKLDTDERLQGFEQDLDALNPRWKYVPRITRAESGERVAVARLFKPGHWTPWTDDCLLPRDLFGWDTPLEKLQRIWRDEDCVMFRFIKLGNVDDIQIENYGAERPDDYQRRRADHLERIGREQRARDMHE